MQLVEELRKHTQLQRHYVKGHQDLSKKKQQDYTQAERYNIAADSLATAMRHRMTQPASVVVTFSTSRITVYVNRQLISTALNHTLHHEYTNTQYWKHLEKKFNWTQHTRCLIDWGIFHAELSRRPPKQQQQLIKYTCTWLPTGHEVHRHDPTEDHRCPHCKTVHETNAHLLRCPHPACRALWQKLLSINLNNFYHTSNTAQPVRALISQALLQWQRTPGRPYRLPHTHPLHQAAKQQQDIGWQHFLSGRIAQSLIQYQEQYYRDRERPHTENGKTWAKKLLQQIWGHFFEVWKS
jgi:hypothetical protein